MSVAAFSGLRASDDSMWPGVIDAAGDRRPLCGGPPHDEQPDASAHALLAWLDRTQDLIAGPV